MCFFASQTVHPKNKSHISPVPSMEYSLVTNYSEKAHHLAKGGNYFSLFRTIDAQRGKKNVRRSRW